MKCGLQSCPASIATSQCDAENKLTPATPLPMMIWLIRSESDGGSGSTMDANVVPRAVGLRPPFGVVLEKSTT